MAKVKLLRTNDHIMRKLCSVVLCDIVRLHGSNSLFNLTELDKRKQYWKLSLVV